MSKTTPAPKSPIYPLEGKHALVGGSSKGIGRAIAELLASRGATVTLMARNAHSLATVAGGLGTPVGQTHAFLVGSTTEPTTLLSGVQNHVENVSPFHIVVNNVAGPPGGKLVDSTIEQLLEAFQNHILFAHELMRIVVPKMRLLHSGRIINIVSTSVKQPIEGLGVSNTIRGAMSSWSKTLATEVAPFGITVNNVLPGATETERLTEIVKKKAAGTGQAEQQVRAAMVQEIPSGRFAAPQEIASAVGFLASEEASYITGTSLLVDGGRTRALS